MERKKATTTSNPFVDICNKIFNALKIDSMLRPFRRISYNPQPVAAAVADSGTKFVSAVTKLPASLKPEPITGTPHAQVPKKREVAEVGPVVTKPALLPLQASSTVEKVKPTVSPPITQETSQAAKLAAKVESVLPSVLVGEKEKHTASVAGQGKAKLTTKVEAAAPTASAGGQAKAKVATKV